MSGGSYRPVLNLPRTLQDNLLELAAVAGLLGIVLMLWIYWPELPARLPTHFGASGLPDAWGGKQSLFTLPIVGFFLYLMMTAVYRAPQIYNYPVQLTEANAATQYRLACTLIQLIKAEIIWLFWYLEWQTIQVGLGKSGGLGGALPLVVLPVLFGTVGLNIWLANRNRGGGADRKNGGA